MYKFNSLFWKKKIYENLNFTLKKGKVVGLLGKNGVGKSTTINILMGNLAPTSGKCLIYGEDSSNLSAKTKAKIGLLYEGHITYDYLKIKDLYQIYAKQYKKTFKKERFFELFSKLGVDMSQKISSLSCGQRSQVVLGLIFASSPELLILDDYSLGLDTGYRRLFIDYLKEYLKSGEKSVLMTTHIVNDLDTLLDEIIIMQKNKPPLSMDYKEFRDKFKGYALEKSTNLTSIKGITSSLEFDNRLEIYGFIDSPPSNSKELNLSFEDAFLGYTGRY
ncbi:ABC transporter ATP-binding protein [Campylobacter sp. FMV-PI01]|uniref:ABC transporter ATP-binding protein n=1 Tax=Campylobacter portucalensis TaxID=2608384 RepID=A0A6L5WFY4_9BACT|nr:ABC transporter ATP-binding protein [Campylobacter portucalensis]MSN95809.1 ABC transporter ATP-binding protein [Campylobacter portucalensis]